MILFLWKLNNFRIINKQISKPQPIDLIYSDFYLLHTGIIDYSFSKCIVYVADLIIQISLPDKTQEN